MALEVRFCARADGVRLAYGVVGSGPPLVWVPGWINHLELLWERRTFRAFIERLARTRTVVLYDKHGVGLSDRDRTEYTLDAELGDLRTVVDELDLAPVTLLGNSQGGAVAAAFAARYPGEVERLVLHGAWAHIGDSELRRSLVSVVQAHWGIGSDLLSGLFFPGGDREQRAWYTRLQRESADADTAVRLLELCYDLDVRSLLPAVRAPALVLHRTRDRVVHHSFGRELAALLPDARFLLMQGRFHFPWEEDAAALLDAIDSFLGVVPARAHDQHRRAIDPIASRAVLRRDGDVWVAGFQGQEALLKDVKGLHYLAELLARPGAEAHAVELVAAVEGAPIGGQHPQHAEQVARVGPDGDLGPTLDKEARRKYAERLRELRDELQDLEAANDLDRATAARTEIDALTEQLAAAVGLGGRDRPTGTTSERARVKVTRLVRDAIRRIDEVDPELGHLLRSSVTTGTYCSYEPPPDGGPEWEL